MRATGVKAGKVNLTKVAWMMPRVIPNDDSKAELNQLVGSEVREPTAMVTDTTINNGSD